MITSPRDDDYAADPVPIDSRVGWPLIFFAEMGIGTAMFFLQVTSIIALSSGSLTALVAIAYSSVTASLIGVAVSRFSVRTGFGMNLLARRVLGYRGAFVFSLIYGVNALVFFDIEARIMASSIAPMIPWLPPTILLPAVALAMIPLVWCGMRLLARFQLVTFALYAVLMAAAVIVSTGAPDHGRNWLHYVPMDAPAWPTGLVRAIGIMNSVVFVAGLQTADYARFVRRADLRAASLWLGVGFQLFCFAFSGLLGVWFSVRYLSTNPGSYMVAALSGWGTLLAVATQLRINLSNLYSGSMAFLNTFRQIANVVVSRRLTVVLFGVTVSAALVFNVMSDVRGTLNLIGLFTTCFTCLVLLDIYVLHPDLAEDARVPDWRWPAIAALVIATAAGSVLQIGVLGPMMVSLASLVAAGLQSILYTSLGRTGSRRDVHRIGATMHD